MVVGDRVKERRLRSGMSQEDLARRVGVSSQVVVARWESSADNKRSPRPETLQKLAEVLNVDPLYLTGETDEPGGKPRLSVFCDSVGYDADVPLAPQHDEPATKADIARLEARLDALTRLLEERLPR